MTSSGYSTSDPGSVDVQSCPEPAILQRFVTLSLSPTENLAVRSHVEQCHTCQVQLDALTESSHIQRPRQLAEPKANHPTVRRLVRLLCNELSLTNRGDGSSSASIPLEHSPFSDGIGRLGRFVIRRELASGATATVFEAVDTLTDSPVAIKFIRGADSQLVRRAQREAEALRRIEHPNVVSLHSVEMADDGRVYLVMPLFPGKPLSDRIAEHCFDSPRPWVELILQIADGLATVHQQGLLHRDIKPSNILVDDHGLARLTDFGLAAFQGEASSLTGNDVILGTPVYMSPEQAAGQKDLDPRADLYSLGATLYECLTGHKPFRGHPQQVIRQIFEREPVRPRVLDETIPRPLEAVILKSMNKSRAARYQTADEFAEDLRRWLSGKPVRARPPNWSRRLRNWINRERKLAALIAATAFAISLATWTAWSYWTSYAEQQRIAQRSYESALQSVFTLAELAESSLDGDPGTLSMRSQLQQTAESYFAQFSAYQPQRPEQLGQHLSAIARVARLKMILDGPQAAKEYLLQTMDDVSDHWATIVARDQELQRHWVHLTLYLAETQLESSQLSEASATLERARAQIEDGQGKHAPLLADYHRLRGAIFFQQLQYGHALGELEIAHRLIRSCIANAESTESLESVEPILARVQHAMAICHLNLNELKEARRIWEELYRYGKSKSQQEPRYLERLESLKIATNLVSVLVLDNQPDTALQFAQAVRPELELLKTANPTLMMPLILELGLDHDEIAARILLGQFDAALEQSQFAKRRADELVVRFPNQLRSNQSRMRVRFQQAVCLIQLADYQESKRILRNWYSELEMEKPTSLVAEQLRVMQSMLMANLAIIDDWSGDPELGVDGWESAIEQALESLRDSLILFSQVDRARALLDSNQPVRFKIANPETAVQIADQAILSGQVRYPSCCHALAELHCLMIAYWLGNDTVEETYRSERIDFHSRCGREFLAVAHNSGFYNYGNRQQKFREDPLFKPLQNTPEWLQIAEGTN